MSEFLDMSGYGGYVWSAYAIAVGGLVLNIWLARRQLRNARETGPAPSRHEGQRMTPTRRRRLYMVLGILAGVAVAAGFGFKALESSIGFRTPTDVLTGKVETGKRFQLGGMVQGRQRAAHTRFARSPLRGG